MQLEELLTQHRAEIVERCRLKVAGRRAPRPTDAELERGIPIFVDQLIDTLQRQLAANPDRNGVAARHGGALMDEGVMVAQVVHDYADVLESVTEVAIELGTPISNEDFRLLSRCVDGAIADAVTEFSRRHDLDLSRADTERLGILAHEMRNLLLSATLTFEVLRSGRVGLGGATGLVHQQSLARLGALVDRSLAHVRLEAGNVRRERIEVRHFLEAIEITASLSANERGVVFSVAAPIDPGVSLDGDPQVLSAVVVNLVQNAVKFTPPRGHVALRAHATADRLRIEVADECGGLPPGAAESLFQAFEQRGTDHSGLGLGLTVARRGAEAHGGEISVRDVPGTGCVFAVELPRAR